MAPLSMLLVLRLLVVFRAARAARVQTVEGTGLVRRDDWCMRLELMERRT